MKLPSVADDFAGLAECLKLTEADRRHLLPHIQRAFYAGYMTALTRSAQAALRPTDRAEAWLESVMKECGDFAFEAIAQAEAGEAGRGKG